MVYHRGGFRTKAAIFIKGMQRRVIPGFKIWDLVPAQIKCWEGKDQKDVVVCLTYFPSDSVEISPSTECKAGGVPTVLRKNWNSSLEMIPMRTTILNGMFYDFWKCSKIFLSFF